MKAPKEIMECVEKYEKLNAEARKIEKEMDECKDKFIEWIGENGVYVGDLFIADKPEGDKQPSDGEYCDQYCHGEDWYSGTYYHQIEDNDKYVAYKYEC